MIERLDVALAQTGSLRAVAILRIAAGPLVLLHLRPFLTASLDGHVPGDTFVVRFAEWYPVAPRSVYLLLLWVTVPVALLLAVGLFTRAASIYTAGFVGYNLFLSQTHFHHNRAFLLILLVGLAVLRSGDHLSVDSMRRRKDPEPAPLWPLWLLRFEVAAVYIASGFSKLIDADWFSGTVLRLRVEQWHDVALSRGVPERLLDLVSDPTFMSVFAKVVVLTELLIGVGLLWRRTRTVAIWVAIPFHLSIELTASVQVFSWAALAALVIWVTPRDHDRRLTLPSGHWLRPTVRWLDWTGRLRVDEGRLRLVERDGAVVRDRDAVWATVARLPLTFWFVEPIRWWRTRRQTLDRRLRPERRVEARR